MSGTFAATVIEVPDLSQLATASDAELMDAMRACARARRQVDAVMASLAGETARRSARELGYAGLAQRFGARTPDALVSQVTGASGVEARHLVTVGAQLTESSPWLAAVNSAVADGSVSVGAAAAITTGLGEPSAHVAADDLQDAAQTLLADAASMPPERVARRARELRDELDARGVVQREHQVRERRFLRLSRQSDGMTRLFGMLDPESAALLTAAIDCVTAPRRGGPRFVDAADAQHAGEVAADTRTTEQLALDALIEMVRIAAAADTGRVFATKSPSVRIHVSAGDLARGEGAAVLEGQTIAVSVATVERFACADGYLPVVFRSDGSVDVGRAQRTFTSRQRVALAAIWGGCAFPGCDRPPSWCEAHHAVPWSHGGRTDVNNGVLLCRHHHLLVHDDAWSVAPPGPASGAWVLHPPPGDPLHREPIELVSKHPDRLVRRRDGGEVREVDVHARGGSRECAVVAPRTPEEENGTPCISS